MAQIGFDYNAEPIPSKVGARFGLGVSNTTIRVTVKSVDSFIIKVTPTGDVPSEILSGVAEPLAQTLGVTLAPLARHLIEGVHMDVLTIHPATHEVDGEKVTVSPADLSISEDNGMLKVSASLNVTLPQAS
jgi:hypothetical protein